MLRRTGDWKRPEPPRWGYSRSVSIVRAVRFGLLDARRSTARLLAVQAGVPITLKTKLSTHRRHLSRHPGPNGAPWELSIVETGATVPGYSGGLAACVVVSYPRPEGTGARVNVSSSSAFISLSFIFCSIFDEIIISALKITA